MPLRDPTGQEEGMGPDSSRCAGSPACAWEQPFYLNFPRIATLNSDLARLEHHSSNIGTWR
jgi:hypothetical protein